MSKSIIEIEMIQAGQPRAYADSIYEAYITCRNEGKLMHDAKFYTRLKEADVKQLTRLFVHDFVDEPEHPFQPQLNICQPVGATPEMKAIAHERWQPKEPDTRWHVRVQLLFTD